MGNAIVARLGIDSAGFRAGLAQAQNQLDGFKRKNSGSAGGGGHGKGGSGGANQAIGDTINAVTGGSGAVTELGILTHSLGLTALAAGGIVVGVKAYEQFHEAIVKVREANDEAAKSFSQSEDAIVGGGVEAISKKLGEIEGLTKKLEASRGLASLLSQMFGGGEHMESLHLQNNLEKERTELLAKSGEKIREQTAERLQAIQGGEQEVAFLKVREQYETKIAAIKGNDKLHGTGLAPKLMDQATAERDAALDDIKEKFAAKQAELSLERQISYLKTTYEKPEELIAKARKDAAEEELRVAKSPEAKDLAKTRLEAAKAEIAAVQAAKGKANKAERIARDRKQDDEETSAASSSMKRAQKYREDSRNDRIKREREQDDLETKAAGEALKKRDSVQERSKLTLGDLASEGHGKDANAARRVQRLEGRARKHALHGNARPDLIEQADKIRNGIGSLQKSEKTDTALQAALDACKIATTLEDIKKDGIPMKPKNQ